MKLGRSRPGKCCRQEQTDWLVSLSPWSTCETPVATPVRLVSPRARSTGSGQPADAVEPASITPSDPIAKGTRTMKHLVVGAGALVFVGLVCTRAPAQDVPAEVRKHLSNTLQGSFLVFREKVQDDLKLTSEQKEKVEEDLRERLPDTMQFLQKLDGLNNEEREKEVKAYRPKAQEKLATFLKQTLKDEQLKRLRQLELQRDGAFVLLHGDDQIRKDLKITDEQRKQFMGVVQDLQKKIAPLIKEAQSGGDPQEIWPKIMKIRNEQEGKIEALLTDTQKKQWKEMLGKPLNLDE